MRVLFFVILGLAGPPLAVLAKSGPNMCPVYREVTSITNNALLTYEKFYVM
jgi:hypothetical protein